MTRAVVATAYGGPEVLAVVDVPAPAPGRGEVSVEVRAAATNPFDLKLYSGALGADPARLPIRLGSEAAGVVVAVGAGAAGPTGPVAVGDEVVVFPARGAYAERVVAPGSSVLAKPGALTFEESAGLMLAGTTAVHALTAVDVGVGDTVLVHGASGGVGSVVAQVAIARGARVVGMASPARHDDLRRLGVLPVPYGEGLAERVRALAPGGVDAAVDTVGTDEAVDVSVDLVADRRRVATIAAFARGAELGLSVLGSGPGADPGSALREAARVDLLRLVVAGALRVRVARAFPLEQASDAHRMLSSGHAYGKVVLVP